MKERDIAVVMVGKTHSGKSVFSQSLKEQIGDITVIETDPITKFLHKEVPILYRDREHDGSFADPSLKYLVFITILEFEFLTNVLAKLMSSSVFSCMNFFRSFEEIE